VPLLPVIAVVEVLRDPLDFRYRLTGTELDLRFGGSLTGRLAGGVAYQRSPGPFWGALAGAAAGGLPSAAVFAYPDMFDGVSSAEVLALPYTAGGSAVDRLILGFGFQAADG
jgi:hypothetical protein